MASVAALRQTEPAKLTKLVRGELDWIAMKALEKDRNRRYETASAFAMDVQRYLNDEPVQACPPSAGFDGYLVTIWSQSGVWSAGNLRYGAAPNDDVSHTFTVPSESTEARRCPSGLNARLYTATVWPRNVRTSRPVNVSQIITVKSSLAEAR